MRRADAFEQTRLMKESVCFFDENAFGGTFYDIRRRALRGETSCAFLYTFSIRWTTTARSSSQSCYLELAS